MKLRFVVKLNATQGLHQLIRSQFRGSLHGSPRREYGIFVTTSYFTKQAQKEVLSDGYPVHLIAGADLVNILKHLRLLSDGVLRADWLESVSANH